RLKDRLNSKGSPRWIGNQRLRPRIREAALASSPQSRGGLLGTSFSTTGSTTALASTAERRQNQDVGGTVQRQLRVHHDGWLENYVTPKRQNREQDQRMS